MYLDIFECLCPEFKILDIMNINEEGKYYAEEKSIVPVGIKSHPGFLNKK